MVHQQAPNGGTKTGQTAAEQGETSVQLADKYRPKQWAEVVGQDKVVSRLQALVARGSLTGRAYWLSGQSGTGKTTIARLIAAEVADEFFITELDAGPLTVACSPSASHGVSHPDLSLIFRNAASKVSAAARWASSRVWT